MSVGVHTCPSFLCFWSQGLWHRAEPGFFPFIAPVSKSSVSGELSHGKQEAGETQVYLF